MAIMVLSSQNKQLLFDPIRRRWIKSTPEEEVRQRCVRKLIDQLGFPMACLVVEKTLKELPHLARMEVPHRRVDILCLAPRLHPEYPLFPLLMIECKEDAFDRRAMEQVLGYNFFVRAPYVAVVNKTEEQVAAWSTLDGQYRFFTQLPPYQAILSAVNGLK